MKFFTFLLLALMFSFAEVNAASTFGGQVFICEEAEFGDTMELHFNEEMSEFELQFGASRTRFRRNLNKTGKGHTQFLSSSGRSLPMNISNEILDKRNFGRVWIDTPDSAIWNCKLKIDPEPTNHFFKASEFQEESDLMKVIRLLDGRIVTVTTGGFHLSVWTEDNHGFSKTQVLNGHTSYIEQVIELRDGGIASLSPRSGEVRIWTETSTGDFESKAFSIGIDGKRAHTFIELTNRTLVVTNGTELVLMKPRSTGTFEISRLPLPVSGANRVIELSLGRMLVRPALSNEREGLLLTPNGENYEATIIKTPRNNSLYMLPSGQIASLIWEMPNNAGVIEIWKPDFVVGGENVERQLRHFYSSFQSLTELKNGDIVFYESDNAFRIWEKSTGNVEFLAKNVSPSLLNRQVAPWIPVVPPSEGTQSFLFVDRDTVSVWKEKP